MIEKLVPRAGVEPARPFGQRILSPQRLPFRHPGTAVKIAWPHSVNKYTSPSLARLSQPALHKRRSHCGVIFRTNSALTLVSDRQQIKESVI